MLLAVRKNFLRFILFLLLIVTTWLVWQIRVDPSHLYLELSSSSKANQKVSAFFYQTGKTPDAIAFRNLSKLNQVQSIYLNLPLHFRADGAIIDLGEQASSWTIHKVALRSRFLFFSLDTHRWHQADFSELISSRQSETRIEQTSTLNIINEQTQPRIFVPIETNSAQATAEFHLVRIGLILLITTLALFLLRGDLFHYLLNLFRSRDEDWQALLNQQKQTIKSPWFICGAISLLLLMAYRLYPYWFAPGFYIEDTMEFADAASGRSSIFNLDSFLYYRGYFVFVSEILVAAINLFPTTWAGHLYMFAGAGLLFITLNAVNGAGLFNSSTMKCAAPSLLLLGAFTDKVFFLSITGTLFSTTLLLIALAFWPTPKQRLKLVTVLVLIAALAWSGPYSAQMLPFAILMCLFFGSGSRRWFYLYIAVLAVAYIASSAAGLTQFSNFLIPEIPVAFFRALTQHILFFNLFGLLDYKFGIAAIFATATFLYFWRKDRVFHKAALVFLAIGLSSFLTYYISSKFQQYNGRLLSYHVVMSQFFWLLFLLLCADRFIQKVSPPILKNSISVVVVLGFVMMAQAKEKILLTTTYFPPDPMLQEFLSAVDYAENMELAEHEFIQLWYVKRRQLFTTSFVRGSVTATAVNAEDLPENVKKFLAPAHLQREINSMVDYDTREGVLIYADLEDQSFKRKLGLPNHPIQ